MGIGGFLASQAERDQYRYLRRTTQARIRRSCDGEVEREVHAILGPVGVDQTVSRRVAHSLREVEFGMDSDQSNGHPASASASASATDTEHGLGLRWSQSVGVTEFLLKFGEGLGTHACLLPGAGRLIIQGSYFYFLFSEEVPTRRLYLSAFTIGMGYLIGGTIPLLPYFFIPTAHIALIYSSIFTGIVLLIFGAVKARVTGAAGKGAGGYVWGAVSTLAVGGLGAAAAYGMVALLEATG
jgi:VIT1/CCC1 family predicted Fe2+/Mn2+ transporter